MSGTVIDQLVVTLGLDASKFTKGQKEALDAFKKTEEQAVKTGKNVEKSGQQTVDVFDTLGRKVLGVATAFLSFGAIKQFVENANKADAAAGRLSKNLGMGIEQLTAWEGVARRFGSSNEDMDAAFRSMQKLAQTVQLMGELPEEQNIALVKMGVNTAKFVDKTTTVEQKLRMIQQGLSRMSAEEAQFWGQKLGLSESNINMLRETSGQMDELLDKQKKMNVTNKEDEENAKARTKAYADLFDTIERKGKNALNALTPLITRVMDDLGHALIGWGYLIDKGVGWAIDKSGVDAEAGKAAAAPSTLTSKPIRRPAAPATAPASSSGNYDVDAFMRMGWTREQALGIVANIQRESGGNSTAFNPEGGGNGAYGLAQWRGSRQTDFKAWAGKDLRESTREEQLAFINHELRSGKETAAGRSLSGATTAEDAARVVSSQYERHNNLGEDQQRALLAAGMAKNQSSQTVSIGQVIVNTKATDAPGIAKDIGQSLKSYSFGIQANPGIQ